MPLKVRKKFYKPTTGAPKLIVVLTGCEGALHFYSKILQKKYYYDISSL